MIRAIVAHDDMLGIAANGHPPYNIPWDIPDDQLYYKQKTSGGIIVMGRGTYNTLSDPLPNRRNVVVSKSLSDVRQGFELVNNLHDYLRLPHTKDVWIIGGATMYSDALEYCDELYVTHVEGDYNCDTFFPKYAQQFTPTWGSQKKFQNGYTFSYAIYTKSR